MYRTQVPSLAVCLLFTGGFKAGFLLPGTDSALVIRFRLVRAELAVVEVSLSCHTFRRCILYNLPFGIHPCQCTFRRSLCWQGVKSGDLLVIFTVF